MAVFFVANVGNRDVMLTDDGFLPETLERTGRVMGQYLSRNYGKKVAQRVELPIICPALDYVLSREQRVDRVLLLGSDQKEPSPAAGEEARQHWLQDTIYLAEVAKRWLEGRYQLAPDAIECVAITENPANYGDMYAFFGRMFGSLMQDMTEADVIYLELAGGTPQMTSMLLVRGVECFGERAVPLYVAPQFPQPIALNIGRDLCARSLMRAVQADLDTYSYTAACRVLEANEAMLRHSIPYYETLNRLLRYAHHRLNFNFAEALQELSLLNSNISQGEEEIVERVHALEGQMADRSSSWLLNELVFNAEIKWRTGQYADFLARIFRFTEAALRFMASEKLDVGFADASGRRLDEAWLDSVPGLRGYLNEAKIWLNLDVTQMTLEKINRFLTNQPGYERWQEVLDGFSRFESLKELRNRSVIAHDYEGVSEQKLVAHYKSASAEILKDMREITEAVTGQPLGDNPFDAINAFCGQFLQ